MEQGGRGENNRVEKRRQDICLLQKSRLVFSGFESVGGKLPIASVHGSEKLSSCLLA